MALSTEIGGTQAELYNQPLSSARSPSKKYLSLFDTVLTRLGGDPLSYSSEEESRDCPPHPSDLFAVRRTVAGRFQELLDDAQLASEAAQQQSEQDSSTGQAAIEFFQFLAYQLK